MVDDLSSLRHEEESNLKPFFSFKSKEEHISTTSRLTSENVVSTSLNAKY